MNVYFKRWITRDDVRGNPKVTFLFGDNLEHRGMAGQAGAMRGEPNAIGIPTKKKPSNTMDAYMTDTEFLVNKRYIDIAFDSIPLDRSVVIPEEGLGTGLAELNRRAPMTFQHVQNRIAALLAYAKANPTIKKD